MKRNTLKAFNLAFLFIFLCVTLFINFFHIETNITEHDNCPACHFQSSVLTTSQINFFHLPPPSLTGILNTFYSIQYTYIFAIPPSSRSPPEI